MASSISSPPLARPRLRAGVEPRLTADDQLYLLRDLDGDDLLIETDGRWTATVLRLCDGTRDPDAVGRALAEMGLPAGEQLSNALSALTETGLLEEAAGIDQVLDAETRARFDRQLAYFSQLVSPVEAAEAQARLRRSRVCLLGLGGLGSWTAWALACCGIGELVGVDGDVVELSNLNRQILFGEGDIGQPKAVAAARTLTSFNGGLRYVGIERRLSSEDDVDGVIAGADLVIDAADWPPHRLERWVNAACWRRGIPFLTMSQQPPLIRVGPLYVRGETGCYSCQEIAWRREHPLYDAMADAEQPFSPATTFGPACGAVGSLAASEAVHFLAAVERPATIGSAAFVDMAALTVERRDVLHESACRVCGT